ncbi:MAG: hypothetical protein ACRCYO_09120 [Bacteroidia bacterium]
MKKILLFVMVVFFLPSKNFAQQMSGFYCCSFGFVGGDCFTFFENNRFQYTYADCTGMRTGSGTYALTRNTITFHYTNDSLDIPKSKANIVYIPADSEKLKLSVHVFDLHDSSSLPFAAVVCEDTLTHECFGGSTNLEGYISFDLLKNYRCYKISIRYIGYDMYDTFFVAASSGKLTISLASNYGDHIQEGTESKYHIKRRGKNKFLLKSIDEDAKWQTYKKKDC